jgi:hypothetical protein
MTDRARLFQIFKKSEISMKIIIILTGWVSERMFKKNQKFQNNLLGKK